MNPPGTIFDPASPQAGAVSHLFVFTLVVCGVIFAIVAGVIFYSIMRFRWREGDREPKQKAGNKRVELIWTVIPFFIVTVLFVLTMRTMSADDPAPAPTPDLIVVGHQWWWEVNYPRSGVITANEIHIPLGRPISVELRSADVLHEFWVAPLTRKMTTVPGRSNHVWLQADKPGTYLGVCSEFCGTQHAWMRFTVVAEDATAFAAWQQAQLKPATAPATEASARGLALFKEMSCASCHAIQGTGLEARVAPDLTHFTSRTLLGSGVADNTSENLRRWLVDPQLVKPGVKMPNFKFTEGQVADLTAYLGSLK